MTLGTGVGWVGFRQFPRGAHNLLVSGQISIERRTPSFPFRPHANVKVNHSAERLLSVLPTIHGGQTHDACAVPVTILQKKMQTNVESFT